MVSGAPDGQLPFARRGHQSGRNGKAFGPERYARLVEIKKAHDPANVFRLNHNIPAA
ncbi:BBE domain-containing protein [Amycolatopsis sp. NPDC023774]|uniref:BBE domain-containing protein n=1 Tax=Amycolatopsis sp. NPDC023774 TaxID=3155015 RepID=UPI0033DD382B